MLGQAMDAMDAIVIIVAVVVVVVVAVVVAVIVVRVSCCCCGCGIVRMIGLLDQGLVQRFRSLPSSSGQPIGHHPIAYKSCYTISSLDLVCHWLFAFLSTNKVR
jgi:hypothetical protein